VGDQRIKSGIFGLLKADPGMIEEQSQRSVFKEFCDGVLVQLAMLLNRTDLVHRLISERHTVGCKRVWMLGMSEERIRCDT
jgi:hypothetical protein